MEVSTICRYCGGKIRLVPARAVYGSSVKRLHMEREYIYQCQNCNARVGCHKGTKRPLGNVANETLRLKRMETHQIFDAYWRAAGMSRSQAYRWLAEQLGLAEAETHIGSFEMDECAKVISLCQEKKEAA